MSSKIKKRYVLFHPGMELNGAKSYYIMLKRAMSLEKRYHGYNVKVGKLDTLDNGNLVTKVTAEEDGVTCETTYEFQDTIDPLRAFADKPYYIRILAFLRLCIVATLDLFVFRSIYAFFKGGHYRHVFQYFWLYHYCFLALVLAAFIAYYASMLTGGVLSDFGLGAGGQVVVQSALWGILFHLINQLYIKYDDKLYIYYVMTVITFRFEVFLGKHPDFNEMLENHTARLKELLDQASDVETAGAPLFDELVISSHCQGGIWAIKMLGDYLLHDDHQDNLFVKNKKVKLVTTGAPYWILWYSFAKSYRRALDKVSQSTNIFWVDVFSPFDQITVPRLHPYEIIDLKQSKQVLNPTRISAKFRESFKAETLDVIKYDLFKVHFLYLMANETGTGFNYNQIISSPNPIESIASEEDMEIRDNIIASMNKEDF